MRQIARLVLATVMAVAISACASESDTAAPTPTSATTTTSTDQESPYWLECVNEVAGMAPLTGITEPADVAQAVDACVADVERMTPTQRANHAEAWLP